LKKVHFMFVNILVFTYDSLVLGTYFIQELG
jgi:hypothetical protein